MPPEPDPLLRSRTPHTGAHAARTVVLADALQELLADRSGAPGGPGGCDVVDLGGGTGGFAVPVAEMGHRVTVVDPSPDALAALGRRASEAGVAARVRAVQGDADTLVEVVGASSADLVLCHGVLEYVEDVGAALAQVTEVLRPGGIASVLVVQRLGTVLARALAGRFAEALQVLQDPQGRWGPTDPLPRRFDQDALVQLLAGAGLQLRAVHGVRVFADLVPGGLVDADPDAAQALLALERAASGSAAHPQLAGLAARLHVVAARAV